eukprot:TRINITY_DN13756_c0_g1_i1.p1 TRINITY_DN13756_c0_g1~~TRINITY_DN13756_c0_g1_i1.p1  ORF type:complete len:345 (-),score=70.80 TRINITY_DN13756_c0_g1_i1:335-1369(-)
MSKKLQSEAKEEVALLRKVSHGCIYIVQYIESFLDAETLHIVMELCAQGDLAGYLRKNSDSGHQLPEDTVWKFSLQVGLGLRWLHSNRVLHRDVKPLNVFLTAEDNCRIGDLGIARMLSKDCDFAKTLIGTPFYLSPEVCNAAPYNDRSDVWAYGCVVYELCTLKRPFEAKNNAALLLRIMEGRYEPVSNERSVDMRDLIDSCLEKDSSKRPRMKDIMDRSSMRAWAQKLGLVDGSEVPHLPEPERAQAWKKWRKLSDQITRLYEDVVKALDAPMREIWDNLYRLFRAKMASDDLDDDDYAEIEKHVFEELPIEKTELIMKVSKILQMEAEAEHYQKLIMPPSI